MASRPAVSSRTGAGSDGAAKAPLRAWLRLFSCAGLIEREIQARLRREFACSLPKFDYLSQLHRVSAKALTMGELGERLMVSGGNITGLTDRLSADGLVERRAHPSDRRVQIIALTSKGRKLFTRMAAAHERWLREMLAGLEPDGLERLMVSLDNVKVVLERAGIGLAAGREQKEPHDG